MVRFLMIFVIALHTGYSLVAQKKYRLDFGCYVGGKAYEQVRDITTDNSGNIYVTGGTSSPDFFTTPGAYSNKLNEGGANIMDAFIMKFDSGGKLIWATLLGGPEYDRAYAIEVDRSGYVYIAGRAGKGLPCTEYAFQKSFAGDTNANRLYGEQDGFVAKLSADGSKLVWCSYFGAPDRGFIRDLAIDSNGHVYIVATETSADYVHITENALQKQRHKGYEGVIAKISTDGRKVLWATYMGGNGNDFVGPSISINRDQNIVVCGTTTSDNMMVSEQAFDKSYNGLEDIFIATISNNGSELLVGTYLGGAGSDGTETHNLTVDKDNNIIVAATTSSQDFPVTPGAYQMKYGGSGGINSGLHTNYPFDGFIAKLSGDGTQLLAATYFGGSAGEGLEGVGTDKNGNIYCGGSSYSKEILVSDGGFTNTKESKADQIVACFDKDLNQLLYFSFLGSENIDYGRTLCVDVYDNILIGGETSSTTFPAKNSYNGGRQDGSVAKFRYDGP
jgi:hypothetical protein